MPLCRFQFFFLLGLNGLFNAFKLYRFPLKVLVRDRLIMTTVWTLITSLCVTGWTLAWHESWEFPAKNFFALWAVNWVSRAARVSSLGRLSC